MPETFEVPIFPLNVVLFPGARLPLRIFEDRYKRLFEESLKGGARFGIALIKEGVEAGGDATPFDVGTLAEIEAVDHHKHSIFLLVRGTRRFRVLELKRDRPYLVGRVELLAEPSTPTATEVKAIDALMARFVRHLAQLKAVARALGGELQAPTVAADAPPVERLFGMAFTLPLEAEAKQALLESASLGDLILSLDRVLAAEERFARPDPADPSVA